MSEKILNTRISLKIDTLAKWNNSTLPLKKGEVALATVAATAGNGLTEPVIMLKVGEDGVKTFSQLDWNVYAKASDVLSACKSDTSLTAYINNLIDKAGLASNSDLTSLGTTVSAHTTALETLNGAGEGSVSKKISDAIAALNIGNYATKTEAQGYANAKDAAIAEAKKAGTDAASALAEYKTSNNTAVSANTSAIETLNGTGEGSVSKKISTAIEGLNIGNYATKSEAQGYANAKDAAITAAQNTATNAVNALEEYKTSNNTAVSANTSAIETLNGTGEGSVSKKISTAIEGLNIGNYATKTEAQGYADGKDTAIAEAKKAGTDANAALEAYKTSNDTLVNSHTSALEVLNGTGEGSVSKKISTAIEGLNIGNYATKAEAQGYADAKDSAIAEAKKAGTDAASALETYKTSNNAAVSANTSAISGIKNGTSINDFGTAETAIAEAKEAGTNAQTYAEGVSSALEEYKTSNNAAVEANATAASDAQKAADAAQSDLNTFKNTVSSTYESKEDAGDKLQAAKDYTDEKIALLMNNSSGAVDSIMELATAMSDNKGAIEALEEIAGGKASASDVAALTTKVGTLETDMGTAKTDINGLKTSVGTKAAQSDLADLQTTVSNMDTAYKAADSAINTELGKKAAQSDLTALDTKVTGILDRFGGSEDILIFDCGDSTEV